jgi:hypothetical protein
MPADIVQSGRRGTITTAATLCDQARAALITCVDPKPIDGDDRAAFANLRQAPGMLVTERPECRFPG